MSLPSFLTMLFDSGCVRVPPAAEIDRGELDEAAQVLSEFEAGYRVSLAGVPPQFDAEVACGAALALYRFCQCVAYRELDPGTVIADLPPPHRAGTTASAHYSADVALR